MTKNKNIAVIGFSVNPELVFNYDRMTQQEKGKLESIIPYLCGTSANVARAITRLGQSSKVLALTGIDNDFESHTLRFVLQKETIPYCEFSILNHSHISVFPIDGIPNPQIFGKKGQIEKTKLKETISKIEEETGQWRVATGVRSEELPLVKALFGNHIGYRLLNPRPELIADRNKFLDILKSTDLLIMNHTEYDACKVTSPSELHQYGPELVIVTENKNGGMFSKRGFNPEMFNPCTKYTGKGVKVYGPGSGDWFFGAYITRCIELEKSIYALAMQEIRDCITFAAQVSGKKVTMPGAANGPTKDDL
jgi:sugar/nucleoside kinase (ribokinase family)